MLRNFPSSGDRSNNLSIIRLYPICDQWYGYLNTQSRVEQCPEVLELRILDPWTFGVLEKFLICTLNVNISVTSTEAERSFSKLKIIKIYLRNIELDNIGRKFYHRLLLKSVAYLDRGFWSLTLPVKINFCK